MQGLLAVPARLVGLALVTLVAAAPAAFSATAGSTRDTTPATARSGFAGPVESRPRAIDRDLSGSAGALREVRCAASLPGGRCWVAEP